MNSIRHAVWVLLVLVPGLAIGDSAQEAAQVEAPVAEAVVPRNEISARSVTLLSWLRSLEEEDSAEVLAPIENELRKLEEIIDSTAERVEVLLTRTANPVEIETEAASWQRLDEQVAALSRRVGERADALESRAAEIAERTELWTRTQAQARGARAPRALQLKIGDTLGALGPASKQARADLAAALELERRAREVRSRLRPNLERVTAARKGLSTALLMRQDEPVWSSIPGAEELAAVPQQIGAHLSDIRAGFARYAQEHPDRLFLRAAVFVLLAWLLSRARASHLALHPERAESASDALRYPWAAAFLAAEQFSSLFQAEFVRGLALIVTPVALLAWFRVLGGLLSPGLRGPLAGLAGLGLLELVRFGLVGVPVVDRTLLGVNLAVALAAVVWLRSPARLAHVPWRDARNPWLRVLGFWMRILGPVLTAGLLAVLLGYTSLADRIALYAVWGTVLGAVWAALVLVGEAVIEHGIEQGALARLRMVQAARPTFLRVVRYGLRALGVFAWAYSTLTTAGLWSPATSALGDLLGASIGYGSVSISLGAAMGFALTLWASWLLARFTSFALDQEVFARVRMPAGVPFALKTFTRYAILVVGFIVAMAAVGFPVDRVTLLLSALGVGIGFGLQNVVNNFVSGLILLFERPVRAGDKIQIAELFGTVSTVGIRSSRVRTFDGADVIVPNADFISARVTNWTFADRQRRITLPVGVAYGTRPRRVIEILEEVARAHPDVLSEPAPEILFRGFGDSSLDFEIRVFSVEDPLRVMSDLALTTSEALEEAGIEIPFPQRDLHLRNIPELRDALKEVVRRPADEPLRRE